MDSNQGRDDPPGISPRSGSPRHFHLLWDSELDDLQSIFLSIQKHRDEVLEHWYQLYVLHFADSRALNRAEFMDIFGGELDETLKDLIARDIDRFVVDVRRVGEML